MKLLFVSRFIPYIGGREVILQSILHKLSKKHQVYLLTPDTGYFTQDFTIYNFRYLKEIPKLIEKIKPDLINIHTFYFIKPVLFVSRKLNIPVVLTLHGLFLNQYKGKYQQLFVLIKKQCRYNNFFVSVVCNDHKKQLEQFGIPSKRIYVIKNGINFKKYTYLNNYSKKTLKKYLYLPPSSKIILTVARFTPLKGLNYLVKAFSFLKLKNLILLILAPTGRYNKAEINYRNYLLKYARKLGCKNKIIIQFHDHESVPFLYKSCDLFVLPSIMEGLPISILEAMASGLITIASNVGGVSEIINDDKNGFLVQPKNYKNILNTITKSLNLNNKEKMKIKQNAKDTIVKYFLEEKMIKQYESLFLNINNKKIN